uniref:Protein-export membrane protein SecG n=1 Tax=candidate division CPR3 bacterium TaxID=2268181 RepID=A0A7C5UU97_UNCC3
MQWLSVVQIIVSILLILFILLQQRGAGLSITFGGIGGGEFYHSRRGIEKFLFYGTIILAMVLVVSSLLILFLKI